MGGMSASYGSAAPAINTLGMNSSAGMSAQLAGQLQALYGVSGSNTYNLMGAAQPVVGAGITPFTNDLTGVNAVNMPYQVGLRYMDPQLNQNRSVLNGIAGSTTPTSGNPMTMGTMPTMPTVNLLGR